MVEVCLILLCSFYANGKKRKRSHDITRFVSKWNKDDARQNALVNKTEAIILPMIKEQLPVAGQRKLMHPELREMENVHDDRS